jgi:hypothetical protein
MLALQSNVKKSKYTRRRIRTIILAFVLDLVIAARREVLPSSLATTPLLLGVSPPGAVNSLLENKSSRSYTRLSRTFSLYCARLAALKAG